MIILNDSVSKFYQCNIWGFCPGISMFLVSALAKKEKEKNTEAIDFLGILKNYVSKNKIYFCLKKKCNGIKKLFLPFARFSNLIS